MNLEEFLINIKGSSFFLSPREKLFLKILSEYGVPEEVVKEGLKDCYRELPPPARDTYPAFLCFKKIMARYESFKRSQTAKKPFNWKEAFERKLALAEGILGSVNVEKPSSEEQAYRVLKELEKEILKCFWAKLSKEEKISIRRRLAKFKEDKDLYNFLIAEEIRKRFSLPDLSLYVD